MMIEWEITLKCNFNCDYCGLLRPIAPVLDEEKISEFIRDLNAKYPNVEWFIFGGEPFLHPKIDFIISELNKVKQPFVIQTNLSNRSTDVITKISEPFKFYCSIHVSQLSLMDAIKNITKTHPNEIHLMYTENTGKVEEYYKKINIIKGKSKLILTPVSNLACSGYTDILKHYDKIKKNYIYDTNTIIYKGKEMLRSDIWMLQNSQKESLTKGKPCMYKGKYKLFNPALQEMNCCYRKSTNGICDEQNCFFM